MIEKELLEIVQNHGKRMDLMEERVGLLQKSLVDLRMCIQMMTGQMTAQEFFDQKATK